MPPANDVSRRGFLGASGVAAAAALTAKSYARVIGANDRIRLGLIGYGTIGTQHVSALNKLQQAGGAAANFDVLAVADCWKRRAEEGAGKIKAKHHFQDYRKILDMADVDYVTVCVPEHGHSPLTLDALDAGKAVYCEKPMTHSIPEALEVIEKQKQTGLPIQVGVQGMSDDSYVSARDAIRGGVIGQVIQAQIDYVRRYRTAGPWRLDDLDPDMDKPADLDWNAWLGHAPHVDWNPHHYFEWRCYSKYSGGIATDLFIHRISRIMKACDLVYPTRVVGMGGIWKWPDGRDLPDNLEMICEYPRGMTVYVLGTMANKVGIDHVIRGYDGTLFFTGSGWVAKDANGKTIATHEKSGAEAIDLHHKNLQAHLRNGEELNCPAELGLAGVVAVNMANESWRSGKMMGWDAEAQKMGPAEPVSLS